MILVCNNKTMRAKTGDVNLANRIKNLRKDLDLTQEKLAEKADISLPLLQKIENASLLGSRVTQQKLANALGVTLSFLLFGHETIEPKQNSKSRIPNLPPDPPLEPELIAALNDPRLGGIFYSREGLSRLSNRMLRQVALDALQLLKDIEESEQNEQ